MDVLEAGATAPAHRPASPALAALRRALAAPWPVTIFPEGTTGDEFIGDPLCNRLGIPLPYDAGPGALSVEALTSPPAFDRARAVASYRGPARALVHALKFSDRLELADMMAGMMARSGGAIVQECEVVVPVPLHRWRLVGRRFNQSALLAAGVARRHALPHEPMALARTRSTRHQVGLSSAERRANVSRAFAVPEARTVSVAGRRVLLVDDVLTTGATVEACTRALRKAGATGVDVLVFARVVGGESAAI